ncbi:hypothetical protein BaRGS_00032071 [Batillaria attramentaria]|uniref:Uncharacterized protein n=1 Tax=Batillaria attramentaria TaxID=370345 RepID=A0ABD0JPD7_9CAEN
MAVIFMRAWRSDIASHIPQWREKPPEMGNQTEKTAERIKWRLHLTAATIINPDWKTSKGTGSSDEGRPPPSKRKATPAPSLRASSPGNEVSCWRGPKATQTQFPPPPRTVQACRAQMHNSCKPCLTSTPKMRHVAGKTVAAG